jgi:hypothetical protein
MRTAKILKKLKCLKDAIATKSALPGSDCFTFLDDTVLTLKEDIVISTTLKTGILGSFPAKDVLKGLESIKEESFVLAVDGNDNLTMTGESFKVKIAGSDVIYNKVVEFYEKMPEWEWKEIPEGFMEGLMLCAETSSKDLKDGEASCVAIKNKVIEATDNIRASVFYTTFKVAEPIYLSGTNVKKLPVACSSISVSENFCEFHSDDGIIYSLPRIAVEFPNIKDSVESWIPDRKKVEMIEFPRELIKTAKEIQHFCGGDSDYLKTVTVKFTKKEIICTAKKEGASIKKIIPNTTAVTDGKFRINPIMLSASLANGDEVFIHDEKIFFIRKDFIHIIGM